MKIFKRINNWFKDLFLEEVDKEYKKPMPNQGKSISYRARRLERSETVKGENDNNLF